MDVGALLEKPVSLRVRQRVTWGMDCARLPAFDWGGKSQSSFPNHLVNHIVKNIYQTYIKITNNTYLKTF